MTHITEWSVSKSLARLGWIGHLHDDLDKKPALRNWKKVKSNVMPAKVKKIRLDDLLVLRGIAQTVEKARALIMSGAILSDTTHLDKAGALVLPDIPISIKGENNPYVSRGGLKLKGALTHFMMDVTNAVVLDVGASTGGFTDCLLQEGARRIFALDVGYGQLAWKLRENPRVVVIERTNIRHYDGTDIDEKPDLAAIDVSFISLKTVLPAVLKLLTNDAKIIALIKPQFEATKEEVGPNGVVSDSTVHHRVLNEICEFCETQHLDVAGTCVSPLLGPAGNKEFFILARKRD